jgi:hypothetical protein
MLLNSRKMDVRNCIADLLSVHDCVIIPGLGGFIGNYSPARIDPVHHAFQPPFKKLLFNVNLKQNDGLLANAVADSYGTSYQDACALIDRFAEECLHVLKSGTSFVIPEVGRLFSGREGNIQFEQDKQTNLLPESFGLISFTSPPISRNSQILGIDPLMVSSGHYTAKKFIIPQVLKWAAILVLPIGFAAVIGLSQYGRITSDATNNANILSSVFSRFSSASLVEKKTAPMNHVIGRKTRVVTVAPVTPPETKSSLIRNDDSFAIIVGAFRVKENAENYVAALTGKGIEASIFDRSRTGLYRVTIGTCSQREEAAGMLARAKSSDFRDAWLLAK